MNEENFENESFLIEDDKGLSQDELLEKTRKLQNKASEHFGLEREKTQKIYVIFSSSEDKQKAIEKMTEYRQIDDSFSFLSEWKDDPNLNEVKSHIGLELSFSKTPQDIKEKLVNFFEKQHCKIDEMYFVSDNNIHTNNRNEVKITNDNVIEIPKRDNTNTEDDLRKAT